VLQKQQKSASTALSSKVVSQYSSLMAPLAVEAVLKVIDPAKDRNVDLKDIRVIKKLGLRLGYLMPV